MRALSYVLAIVSVQKVNGAHRKLKLVVGILCVALIMGLSGCATTTLTDGSNLAQAGQTAASVMEQNVTLSASSVQALKEAVAFNDGYNKAVGNTNSQVFITNIVSIQGKLAQYGNWLESLSSSYSALGSLAGYNASGSFNSSITSLEANTTNFANAIGKPISIPSDIASGVSTAGGLFLGWKQSRDVKQASRQIECNLTNVIAILDDPDARQQLVAIHEEVAGPIDQAALTLINNGVGSYSPLINELGSPLGITATANTDDIVKANKQLLAGLRNVELESVDEQISSQGATYDKSLAALKALVPVHESLQNGSPINMSTITEITSQLKEIALEFQSNKGK
jgi:hypothetical protein